MNRGSEWRIWDLHVHTPSSLKHNYTCTKEENIWDKYIEALEQLPKDIKVLGINDYLFIDGYKKVLEYKNKGRLKNIDLILPVIEFRLAKFAGNEKFKRINYHVIFSNELKPEQIQQQFLNGLTAHYKLRPGCKESWNGILSEDSLISLGEKIIESVPENRRSQYGSPIEEGFNNLNLDLSKIENALNEASFIFKGKYITAIGKSEWDDLKWDDNTIAEKKDIINNVDIIFTSAKDVESFQRSKNKLTSYGVNNLLLDCSDSHTFANDTTNKDRLGNCRTWIKADTTFEGLKQILYEPEERIRIQDSKPDDKNIYQVIDSINLNEQGFWQGTIHLNPNLNTIVGGRSTGKSSLLKAIAAKSGCNNIKNEDFIMKHLEGVSIGWADGENQQDREIEYFYQSYMHDLACDSEKTNNIIEEIIKSNDSNELISQYENNVLNNGKNINSEIFTLFQLQKNISQNIKLLQEKGSQSGISKQIEIFKSKIVELKQNTTLSEEDISKYESCLKSIEDKKKEISEAVNDLAIYKDLFITTPFVYQFEKINNFENLSFRLNRSETYRLFNDIVIKTENEWKKTVKDFQDHTTKEKEKLELEIKDIENCDIYKKGKQSFEGNEEINKISTKLHEEEKKLDDIKAIRKNFDKLKVEKDDLINKIIEAHSSFKKQADNISERIKYSHYGLDICVKVHFLKNEFRDFLESRFYLRNKQNIELINNLEEQYNNSEITSDLLNKFINGDVTLKNSYTADHVAMEFFTKNWYRLDYSLSYQGDSFENMSEGKQAFVILKLLLDFSNKKCPILIDQPEDSLDNRAIYNELVTYIKHKKKERQIILVTHNSNVVVSADAENIIVANQNGINSLNKNGNKFQYINGSLENTKSKDINEKFILESQGIREHICDILEGGRAAFEKREQKYGFTR